MIMHQGFNHCARKAQPTSKILSLTFLSPSGLQIKCVVKIVYVFAFRRQNQRRVLMTTDRSNGPNF
jgi:hypothetical protein